MTKKSAMRASASPLNVVVDLSHHNVKPDFAQAKADGIAGVIHKATQGLTYVDKTYDGRQSAAIGEGIWWGAYHFGTGSDGVHQAEFFLEAVKPMSDTLLVLDFEANPQGPSMTLEEARAFVTHVHDAAGRWPGLYSGLSFANTGDRAQRRCRPLIPDSRDGRANSSPASDDRGDWWSADSAASARLDRYA